MKYIRKTKLALSIFGIWMAGQALAIDFTEVIGNEAETSWLSNIYGDPEGNDRIFLLTFRVANNAIPELKLSEFERKEGAESIWTWEPVSQVERRVDNKSIEMDYDNQCKTLSLSMDATGNRRIKFFEYGDVDWSRFEGFEQLEGFVLDEKRGESWISAEASLPPAGRVTRITELLFIDGNAFRLNLFLFNPENPDRGLRWLTRIEGTSATSDGVLKAEKVYSRNLDGSWKEWRETRLHEERIRMRYNEKCNQLTLIIPEYREGLYSVLRFNR